MITVSSNDDWFGGLNDINDSYGGRDLPLNKERFKISKSQSQTKVEKSSAPPDFDHLRSMLDTQTDRKDPSSVVSGYTKFKRVVSLSNKNGPTGRRAKNNASPATKELSKNGASSDAPVYPSTTAIGSGTPANLDMNALICELQLSRAGKAADQDERLERRRQEGNELPMMEDATEVRLSPNFKVTRNHSLNSLTPKARRNVTVQDMQAVEQEQDPYAKYKAKTSPFASGLGSHISRTPMTMLERWRGQQIKRQNPWGMSTSKPAKAAGKASYNSLRKADRVTPETAIPWAVAASPYGVSSNKARSNIGNAHHVDVKPGAMGALRASLNEVDNVTETGKMEQPTGTIYQSSQALSGKNEAAEVQPTAAAIAASEPETESAGPYEREAVQTDSDHHLEQGSSAPGPRADPEPTKPPNNKYSSLHGGAPNPSDPDVIEPPIEQISMPELGFGTSQQGGIGGPLAELDDSAHAALSNLHRKLNEGLGVGNIALGKNSSHRVNSHITHMGNSIISLQKHEQQCAGMSLRSRGSNVLGNGTVTGTAGAQSGDGGDDGSGDRLPEMSLANAMKGFSKKSNKKSQPSAKDEKDSTSAIQEEAKGSTEIVSMEPAKLEISPLDIAQPPVPYLQHGLDRVLFNPGVYQLQDPNSRVYNFDPYLQKIMPVLDFDFDSLKEYKTSSQDQALAALAQETGKKYIGSTSSMTSTLAHFHYLLSNWRPLNTSMLSNGFIAQSTSRVFTEINRAPSAIFLRRKNGSYAIDADKEFDSANVLMLLGKSMELLLTLPTSEYEKYRKSDHRSVPEEQKSGPESYQYTTMRDFLMRSQLDAYDPRLPGNGTFDLKTRAVVSVRMAAEEFESMTGYELFHLLGKWESYEREYYDMMRSTMLKYMLQARMGRMNGILVAYHNVKRIFGFQYIPISEMDRALHGQADTILGDQEFKASLDMYNEILNKATAKFPEQSLRIHFETKPEEQGGMPTALHVFAEPMTDTEIDRIQNSQKARIAAFERNILGVETKDSKAMETSDAEAESTPLPLEAESGNAVEAESLAELGGDESTENTEAEAISEDDATAYARAMLELESSDSPADGKFLNSIEEQESEGEVRPLFYATIICQTKVNGKVPEGERPRELKETDKWEIDYILKEYEITRDQWALYEDTKSRRRHALYNGREDEDEGDVEGVGKERNDSGYVKFLRERAKQGQEVRDRMDKTDEGKQVVRADQPLPKPEKMDSVADYMRWMYGEKGA